MGYQVLDNNKPADCRFHNVPKSWNKSYFKSWREAHDYALGWLGPYGEGVGLTVNTPHSYTSYGDTIEIRSVDSDEYANVVQMPPKEWLNWLLDKRCSA